MECSDITMAGKTDQFDTGLAITDDTFLGEELSILQPKKGYRAGIDAVLLASTVVAGARQDLDVIDLGAGVGVVGLAVATRLCRARVRMVEKQAPLVELAQRNIERNGMAGRITVEARDIVNDGTQGVPAAAFDHALANPPFYAPATVRVPPNTIKAGAHVMPAAALESWFRLMAHAVKPGGFMTMIHRVEALPELLRLADGRFGALEIQPIHAFANESANRIMLRGTKGSRKPLRLLHGLVVHKSDRSYQPEIDSVLRSPTSLDVFGRS